MRLGILGIAVSIVFILGCGGGALPAANLAKTQAAIRSANEVGAKRTPKAALHLKYAQDQYRQAQKLAKSGKQQQAEMLLLRAEVDAELALALAREAAANKSAREAEEEARRF